MLAVSDWQPIGLEWLRESGRLTLVPASARTPDDPVFRPLRPGDLIFWAREEEEPFRVSHVHLYLGKEADGHAATIAQVCFVLFLILALVSFLKKA